jgi:spore coat polysaccharide biosynthesis protein SpsF
VGSTSRRCNRDTLERLARMAHTPATREHVTSLVLERPDLFCVAQVRAVTDASDLRWTVDTVEDLALVRRLYAELGLAQTIRPYADLVAHVRAQPELARGNAHVAQKHWSVADVA